MLRAADGATVGGAVAVALAAVLGGAFFPGPRLALGVLLALLFMWFGAQPSRLNLTSAEWAVLALVGWGAVAAFVVGMAPLAAKQVVTGWLVAWCLWVVARRASPRSALTAATVLIATAVMVVGGIGLESIARRGLRVGGLLENPNIAAALLVSALPLAVAFRQFPGRRLQVILALVLAGGVVLSGSRAGLLALLAAGAALLPKGRTRFVGSVAGGVAVVVVLVWRFASQPDILAWFRPSIWGAVVRLWAAHPVFGVGPGGLVDAAGPVRLLHQDHVGQHQFLATYAESTPLGLLVQTGVVGVVLAMIAVGLWGRRARRDGVLGSSALRSALLGLTVMAAFHDFVTIEIVLWWWVVVIGLIETTCGQPLTPRQARTEPGWVRVFRGLGLALIVLWGIVQPAYARWLWNDDAATTASAVRAVAAEPWYDGPLEWKARALLDEPQWTWPMAAEALSVSRAAVEIHPGASRLWVILGQVNYRIITEFGPWPESIAESRAAFERASELEPHQPWPWLEWARLERGLGNLDESAILVRRALEAEPHALRASLFLARVELDRGDVSSAREALDSARASFELRKRPGLKTYERELLAVPMWQFREIEEALN